MRYIGLLLKLRTKRFIGPLIIQLLSLYSVDVPAQVKLGEDVVFWHRGQGVVMAPRTTLGDRVHVFHQVTIGGADPTLRHTATSWQGVVVEDDAILCVGAKILAGSEVLRVGRGTIIAANAVLLESTGQYEIWGGIPARRIGSRPAGERNARSGEDLVNGTERH
jgi:serine O-acetyltransferase